MYILILLKYFKREVQIHMISIVKKITLFK